MRVYRIADSFLAGRTPIIWNARQDNLESLRAEVINALDGNDVKTLTTCMDSGGGAATVDRDIAAAKQLAVSSTPTVFINGRRVTHIQSEKALEDLLRGAVNQKQQSDEVTTK